MRRHRARVGIRLAETLVEAALQSKFCYTLLPFDHSTHLEQTVGRANLMNTWRVTTAHDDAIFGLLENLEVVGDDGAYLVATGE